MDDDVILEGNLTRQCREVAAKHGHTAEVADNCDDGNVGCTDCPFKPGSRVPLRDYQREAIDAIRNEKIGVAVGYVSMCHYGKLH